MKTVFRCAPLALWLCLVITSCITRESSEGTGVENYVVVGEPVPEFAVTNSGGTFSSPAGFVGKTTMLVLFNTECEDCKRELPKVRDVWEEVGTDAACQAVAIGRGQTESEIGANWEYGDMPYYGDPKRSVFNLFANSLVPRLYTIDSGGIIRYMSIEHWKSGCDYITTEQLREIFIAIKDGGYEG